MEPRDVEFNLRTAPFKCAGEVEFNLWAIPFKHTGDMESKFDILFILCTTTLTVFFLLLNGGDIVHIWIDLN